MSSPGDSPAAAGVLLRPAAQESAAVPRGSEWLWLPGEGASDWMQPETWSSAAGSRYSGDLYVQALRAYTFKTEGSLSALDPFSL